MDVEDKDADKLMKLFLRETMPLYVQLHAYVRRKLFQFYFDDESKKCGKKPKKNGSIPIHLTGWQKKIYCVLLQNIIKNNSKNIIE